MHITKHFWGNSLIRFHLHVQYVMLDRQLLCECRNFTRPQNPFLGFGDETSPRSCCTRHALQRIILHGHRTRCPESYDRHIETKWSPKRQEVKVEFPVSLELRILPLNLGEATLDLVFNSLFPISVTRWGPRVALKYVIACTAGLNVARVPHTNRWQRSFNCKASVFQSHPYFWYIQDACWELK